MWNRGPSNSSFVYRQKLSSCLKEHEEQLLSYYCQTRLSCPWHPQGFVTGRKHKPNPAVQNFQSLQREEKNPFIMFTFPHCFISLKTSLTTKWSLSGVIGKRWRRFFKAVWMENLKAAVCAERKYCIWSFFMIPADMMYVCIPQPEEFLLFGFLCLSVRGSSTSASFCSIVWELTTT